MNGKIGEFLLHCESLDFGKCELSNLERTFCRQFTNEIVSL